MYFRPLLKCSVTDGDQRFVVLSSPCQLILCMPSFCFFLLPAARSFTRMRRLLNSLGGKLFEIICLLCIIYMFHNQLRMIIIESEHQHQLIVLRRARQDPPNSQASRSDAGAENVEATEQAQNHAKQTNTARKKKAQVGAQAGGKKAQVAAAAGGKKAADHPVQVSAGTCQVDQSTAPGPSKVPYEKTATPPQFQKNNLELYLRLKFNYGWGEARSFVLSSLRMFWPHASVVIAFDMDSVADKAALKNLQEHTAEYRPVQFRGVLRDAFPGKGLRGLPTKIRHQVRWNGFNRAQLDMMFADEEVKSRHVGFIETDTLFTTLVVPGAIFPDGKPLIIGAIGRHLNDAEGKWTEASKATKFLLKKDLVMYCSSYSPMVLVTRHVEAFRKYVEKTHGRDFITAYKEMFINHLWNCHYTLMCNYVWYFHRNEYTWHFQGATQWKDGWQKANPGQTSDFSFLTPANKLPVARVATHASLTIKTGHLYGDYDPAAAAGMIKQGFCFVAWAQCATAKDCQVFKNVCANTGVKMDGAKHTSLFHFEPLLSWSTDQHVCLAQDVHYAAVRRHTGWTSYGLAILKRTQPYLWKKFYSQLEAQKKS